MNIAEAIHHFHKYPGLNGLPLMLGTNANYYYVDGADGKDATSHGRRPDRPYATIEYAITQARALINWSSTPWAKRPVIVISPGSYDENLTALPHGSVMIGLGWDNRDAQMGVKIAPSEGSPVDVGAVVNAAFIGIGFESADTSRAFDSTITNNCLFIGCRFSGAAESVTCTAAWYSSDCTCTKWLDCDFTCAAVGFDNQYVDGGDGFNHNLIQDCRFHQNTTAGLRMSTNLVGPSTLVKNCNFFGGGQTMAIGIDDNSAILELDACAITATDPIQGCRTANRCYGNEALLGADGEP